MKFFALIIASVAAVSIRLPNDPGWQSTGGHPSTVKDNSKYNRDRDTTVLGRGNTGLTNDKHPT